MIYALHAFKVNRAGEPLAKHFSDKQWESTRPMRRSVNGVTTIHPNSGWVQHVKEPIEADKPTPEPLEKTPQKEAAPKVTAKKSVTKKRTTKKKTGTKK